jgi:hypothetical protein
MRIAFITIAVRLYLADAFVLPEKTGFRAHNTVACEREPSYLLFKAERVIRSGPRSPSLCQLHHRNDYRFSSLADDSTSIGMSIAILSCLSFAAVIFSWSGLAFADEYGVETEAPTIFTGEQVMVRVQWC